MLLANDLKTNLQTLLTQIESMIDDFRTFIVGALIAVVIVWCIYIAVRLIVAHRNEERIDAKKMIKNLIVGIVIMFVLVFGVPLLIEGLETWATTTA